MNGELSVRIGTEEHRVFIPKGFYANIRKNEFHKHHYAEMHLIVGGNVKFSLKDKIINLGKGSILVIPSWVLHCCVKNDDNAEHIAFQLDMEFDNFFVFDFNEEIIKEFFKEAEKCEEIGDYTKLVAYISLFCSYLPGSEKVKLKKIEDYSFLLREFFSLRYAEPDISLKDLADELHISERQAERIVMKHTGNTFKKELMLTRMSIAKHWLKMGVIPMSEIAKKIGYRSYAGFWKALKKQKLI